VQYVARPSVGSPQARVAHGVIKCRCLVEEADNLVDKKLYMGAIAGVWCLRRLLRFYPTSR
jgi:hypothetical protein